MTNSANGFQREIKLKGQKLGILKSFEYLETVVLDDGFIPEALSRTSHPLKLLQSEANFDR